jgi:hypothetical protein
MSDHYLSQINHLYLESISEFILHNNISRIDGKVISSDQFKGGKPVELEKLHIKTDEL